ncbi:hypothetical protein SEA_SATIS_285 [Streptomyces phage Satis]|nr:hypothetical protein SEA_SATIS_285 [Streptomyces phage Satis]QBZ72171.1 hypothetical protein SEA_KRADAL_285 [Streptomyces phage Kradal]QPL14593.1 hypothetical protein SEA_EHYELIMAYOE_288 [Streptomyces phage EhyElimayoE]
MAVYGLYVPSSRRPVADLEMEVFASREVAGKTLQRRVLTGTSRTFFTRQSHIRFSLADHPEKAWPVWDETGYMRVWLRRAADPVPGLLSRPDEEWLIRETGAVERIPWTDDTEDTLFLSDTGERALNRPRV